MKKGPGIQDRNIFKFITENPNDAYFLVGRDAKFLYVNNAACKMLGYTQEELLGLSVPDVDAVYDINKYHKLFDLLQQGPIPPIETINKRRDGTEFPSELSVTGYLVDNKQYMFAALRDIIRYLIGFVDGNDGHARPLFAVVIDGRVCGDAEHPRLETGLAPEFPEILLDADQCLLQEILGQVNISTVVNEETAQWAPEFPDDLREIGFAVGDHDWSSRRNP